MADPATDRTPLLPLSRLKPDPLNVRQAPTDPDLDAQLRAQILAQGFTGALTIRPANPDSKSKNPIFYVTDGCRRLAAVRSLAKDGKWPKGKLIPCSITPKDSDPTEISLGANSARAAMDPIDQVTAFHKLSESGYTADEIARRFGVSQRTVEQRLRLASLHPDLHQAYRDKTLSMQSLQAFTISPDHARQLAAFKALAPHYSPWSIRSHLTSTSIAANHPIADYVGLDAYEAAGGELLRNLFGDRDDTWIVDPSLLERLAAARLEEEAAATVKGWKWSLVMPSLDHAALLEYGRYTGEPIPPTDDQNARLEALKADIERLENRPEDELTADDYEALDKASDELELLHETIADQRTWTDDQRANAGIIVHVDDDGSIAYECGLIRPEDVPAANDPGDSAADTSTGTSDADPDAPPFRQPIVVRHEDPDATARKETGIGTGVTDDLRHARANTYRAKLAGDFDAALDLCTFQICKDLFTEGYHFGPLDIAARTSATSPMVRANDADYASFSLHATEVSEQPDLPLDWIRLPADEAFDAFLALPADTRRALFAAAVSRTVRPQLAYDSNAVPAIENTIARIEPDFTGSIARSADFFWSRLVKKTLIAISDAVFGSDWAAAVRNLKKGDLAAAVEQAFAADTASSTISKEAIERARAWLPPGFRAFDTATSIDGDTAPPAATVDAPGDDTREGDAAPSNGASDTADDPEAAPTGSPDRLNGAAPVASGLPAFLAKA